MSKEKLEALRKRIGFKKFNTIDDVVKFLNFTWEAEVPYQRWIDANMMEAPGPAQGEIKAFVSHRLADFKVPRQVVFLNEIPKGPTGKLQRIGLAQKLGLV